MKFRRRAAFTFVEILTVMALIGLLVRIAVPHYIGMKKRAVAAAIYSDLHTIRLATLHYYTDNQKFPPDAPAGQVPPELVQHLPTNFSFVHPDYTYDWQTWAGGDEDLVGVRVASSDEKLIAHLTKMGNPAFIPVLTSSQLTFLLAAD